MEQKLGKINFRNNYNKIYLESELQGVFQEKYTKIAVKFKCHTQCAIMDEHNFRDLQEDSLEKLLIM